MFINQCQMLKRPITGHTSQKSTKPGHPGYKLGHLYICIFRHTLTHTHICTHTHTNTQTRTWTNTQTHTRTNTQTHTRTNTHRDTQHIHMHINELILCLHYMKNTVPVSTGAAHASNTATTVATATSSATYYYLYCCWFYCCYTHTHFKIPLKSASPPWICLSGQNGVP